MLNSLPQIYIVKKEAALSRHRAFRPRARDPCDYKGVQSI